MSDVVIRAEKLGKRYRIGARQRYKSLRETLTAPFRRSDASTLRRSNDIIWALKDVSFEVKRGEVVGIIGRNGAGKSTLLKILSRITEPTEGSAEILGRVGSLLEVGTGFHPELTGRENVYLNGAILGMGRTEIERKFDEIVAFAEVEKFIDTPVKHYSSGMHVRLAFAVAAYLEPDILLVDEVLAVGDASFQKKCLGKMGEVAQAGRTILFVSHNMSAVQRLCGRAILLHDGVIAHTGSVAEVISVYMGQTKANEVRFDNQPIKRAAVRQIASQLELVVEYATERAAHLPCLGFVISDASGNPICGSNPIVDFLENTAPSRRSGRITVVVSEPKLLNGTYRLSLWFGNGKDDYFHARDCLTFDVTNMAGLRQLPPSQVGPVAPQCKWVFE